VSTKLKGSYEEFVAETTVMACTKILRTQAQEFIRMGDPSTGAAFLATAKVLEKERVSLAQSAVKIAEIGAGRQNYG
jgi:hypothetical protein